MMVWSFKGWGVRKRQFFVILLSIDFFVMALGVSLWCCPIAMICYGFVTLGFAIYLKLMRVYGKSSMITRFLSTEKYGYDYGNNKTTNG